MITNLRDLCDYFSADEPRLLNKRVYKATDCGASISLRLAPKVYESLGPIQEWEHFTCCAREYQGTPNVFSTSGKKQLAAGVAVHSCPACGKKHTVKLVTKPLEVDKYRGPWLHNGDPLWEKLTMNTPIVGFTIQTIVEGSDVEVNSDEFDLPVDEAVVEAWIKDMEERATELWEDANNPMCTCGHRSEEHRWAEDPSMKITGAVKGYECTSKDCECKEFKEDEWHGIE